MGRININRIRRDSKQEVVRDFVLDREKKNKEDRSRNRGYGKSRYGNRASFYTC